MFIENNRESEGTTPAACLTVGRESNFRIHDFFYKHVMPLASVLQWHLAPLIFMFFIITHGCKH